jgi:hypothetical protein
MLTGGEGFGSECDLEVGTPSSRTQDEVESVRPLKFGGGDVVRSG